MTTDEMWFWLCSCEGIYEPDIARIINKTGGILQAFEAGPAEYKAAGIAGKKSDALLMHKSSQQFLNVYDKMCRDGIRFIHMDSPEYPDEFRSLAGMPPALYVIGELPQKPVPSVGIVGARACSGYGREKASEFGKALAEAGVQTVSGMAVGIDAISARASLSAGGRTFAVLGCGVDVIYPRDNIDLYYDIIMHGGGIISEYPPGTAPLAWQFPHRNRLISALSDRLIVVEAGNHSGTLTTAGHALDQGREVYALPGRSIDRLSEGCNRLIADGAGILLDINEFIEELYASPRWERCSSYYLGEDAPGGKGLAPDEMDDRSGSLNEQGLGMLSTERDDISGKILSALGSGAEDIDSLLRATGLDAAALLQQLAEMELSGYIVRLPGNYYARKVL